MKKLIRIASIFYCLALAATVHAQDATGGDTMIQQLESRITKTESNLVFWNKLKVNGWIQAQYQVADTAGAASVAGGNFATYSDNRFILRRGRIKFTYEQDFAQYVLQIDVIDPTLNGPTAGGSLPFAVNVRDFFAKINMPFWTPLTLTVGMQNRPFGFEVAQSSQFRETPERSRFTQMLFPNERDLGAMITLQAPASSPLHFFKLNAGLFNGTGIAREYDSRKDFIGQLMMNRSIANEMIQLGIGVSYYNGGMLESSKFVYEKVNVSNGSSAFEVDSSATNLGKYAKREYFGVDAQISVDNPMGITTLRGEYVMGTQPGTASSTRSPELLPVDATGKPLDIYVRQFNAGYFYFIHKIAGLPFLLVFKYDWYDPNTKVSGTEINSAGKFGLGDIRYQTMGYGINYLVSNNVKFMLYYDQITNESTAITAGDWTHDKKDNILTLRVQYRF